MKLRKTPANKRYRQETDGTRTPIYTMYFANGDKVIYEPGKATTIYASGGSWVQIEEGITELTIKQLHSSDDSIVESNQNMVRCETRGMRKEREEKRRQWFKEHPDASEDENPYKAQSKLVSFNSNPNEDIDDDCTKLEYEASIKQMEDYEPETDLDEKKELVRAYVATLPKSQQELYQLLYIEGLSQIEICERLKLTRGTVSKRTKNLNEKLFIKFKK